MKNNYTKCILIAASFFMATTGIFAQISSSDAKQLATRWLRMNCIEIGEEQNDIVKHFELEPYFTYAIENGMEPEVLQNEEALAGQIYDLNIKMLNENKPTWITPEDENKIRSISREEYITNQTATLTSNYKTQAIRGLAIIGQKFQSKEFFNGMKLSAYPNPVNRHTTIEYTLEKEANNVSVAIFDKTGRKFIDKKYNDQSAGTYKVDIEVSDLISGTYFYQVNGNDLSITKKLIVIK